MVGFYCFGNSFLDTIAAKMLPNLEKVLPNLEKCNMYKLYMFLNVKNRHIGPTRSSYPDQPDQKCTKVHTCYTFLRFGNTFFRFGNTFWTSFAGTYASGPVRGFISNFPYVLRCVMLATFSQRWCLKSVAKTIHFSWNIYGPFHTFRTLLTTSGPFPDPLEGPEVVKGSGK